MANESATQTSPFHGMWEIVDSSLGEQSSGPDLKGVKFRMDEMGDIIWFNDVVDCQQLSSPAAATSAAYITTTTTSSSSTAAPAPSEDVTSRNSNTNSEDVFNELASILLSCESYDILTATGATNDPGLQFSTYAGHQIEFKTQSLTPGDQMTLTCDGLYRITCKRMKEGEAIGQAGPFSLISALQEGYFTDVIIKSSDGLYFEAHSVILRLNGFDCSMNFKSDLLPTDNSASALPAADNYSHFSQPLSAQPQATNHFLLPPPLSTGCLAKKGLTGSFNCLSSSPHLLSPPSATFNHHANNSSSDSDLRQSCQNRKEVFNFTTPMTPTEFSARGPPLSPRLRCGTPTMVSCLDTPPTSPLTPISILYNLPCSVLKPIIYWLYTESIPPQLNEETCQKLMLLSEQTPPLNKMTGPCRRYLKNLQLKKYIIDLSMDIHGYLNRIIALMAPRKISHHPRHLCSVFVESLRELSVGCAKILDFCNIFVRDAKHLTRFQRHEIIKYTRSRVPIFLKQWHQILENMFDVLSSLTAAEKAELAVYLVPQIEKTLDQFRSIALDVKTSLERMYEHLKTNGTKGGGRTGTGGVNGNGRSTTATSENQHATYRNKFGETENDLTFFLYMYEVRKTRDIYGRIKSAYETIDQNRYTFVEMSQTEKERTIRRNLDFLLLEFPSYIKRLESLESNFDSNCGWKAFKFCFKLGTGQINGVISKLVEHKRALQSTILRICDLVHRSDFFYTMTNLGILEVSPSSSSYDESPFSPPPPIFSPRSPSGGGRSGFDDNPPIDYKSIKLNLVKHLCESPNILCSNLSKNALRLLHSGEMSDMEFEVIASLQLTPSTRSAFLANQLPKVHVFRAHRAIICSRCEYFRRALLSGMKEDINRKITVQDTSPVIFRRFLLYLYGAPIDKTVGADQICELMLLGDRYSLDELKDICEQILKAQIDEESVILLLSIADRFNANTLKSNCLSFISNRVHLINMDIFVELSPQLQDEVHELIQWRSRTPQPWHTASSRVARGTGTENGEHLVSDESGGRLFVPSSSSQSAQSAASGSGGGNTTSSSSPAVPTRRGGGGGGAVATATASPFM